MVVNEWSCSGWMFDNCSVFIFLENSPPAKDCSEMVTRRFITRCRDWHSPSHIAAVQARSPERPAVARPACTITGPQRNNVLRRTNRADVICGLGGNDIIYGFGGNGNDTLWLPPSVPRSNRFSPAHGMCGGWSDESHTPGGAGRGA